jgi:hypothetical protein
MHSYKKIAWRMRKFFQTSRMPLSQRKNIPKSLPFNAFRGCPSGYQKRSSYKTSHGLAAPTRCVLTSRVQGVSDEIKPTQKRISARRPRVKANRSKPCPPGQIRRTAYTRRYSTSLRQRGYTVRRRNGRSYRVYPSASRMLVRSGCIKNRGRPGFFKGGIRTMTRRIGPLKEGELKKHGYSSFNTTAKRHTSLRKAIKEFGPLGVYRKLNAVSKLGVRTMPSVAKTFKRNRNWVRKTYGPLKAI